MVSNLTIFSSTVKERRKSEKDKNGYGDSRPRRRSVRAIDGSALWLAMGKAEEEQVLPSTTSSDSPEGNAEGRCGFRRCLRRLRSFVGVKCVLVLLLSAALFLSAVFWLPPFLRFADRGDLDLDSLFKG